MYCSDRILQQFVRLGVKPEKLAQLLTERVVEVEALHRWELDGIVVGEVLSIAVHPNADRLRVVKTSVGSKTLTIVCGGTNLYNGQRVAVALEGSRVRWHGQGEKVVLKNTSIRGIESEGMICAASELDLPIANTAIVGAQEPTILDLTELVPQSKPGLALIKALGLEDVRYEIDNKSLARRADLWGYLGIAREVALITESSVKTLALATLRWSTKQRRIAIQDTKGCLQSAAVELENVVVGDSPWELKRQLLAAGMNSVNNIVDITNVVMLETGQPMHAFDRNHASKIVIRKARKRELIQVLNGKHYELTAEDCVITDGKKPVDIAGIIGGEHTGVSAQTNAIVLTLCSFEPVMIRKTSQRLQLRTEASARFEKGQAVEMVDIAARRFLWYLKKYQPKARVVSAERQGVTATAKKIVKIDWEPLDALMGVGLIPIQKAKKILKGLGFTIKGSGKKFTLTVPFWRNDIQIPNDVAEEIVRLSGLNQFTHALPDLPIDPPVVQHQRESLERVRTWLVERGCCNETESYPFDVMQSWRAILPKIQVLSPIAQDCRELRNDLLPNVLEAVVKNLRFRSALRLFEIGRVFLSGSPSATYESTVVPKIPDQPMHCVVALSGEPDQYRQAKGIIEGLLASQGIPVTLSSGSREGLDAQTCQMISSVSGKCLGFFGTVDSNVLKSLDIKQPVVVIDLFVEEVARSASHVWRYKKPSDYPPVLRDLTITIPPHVLYQALVKIFDRFLDDLLAHYELFDIYTPENQNGKRSLSFHLVYQSNSRTLTGQEVDEVHKTITRELEAELHGVVPVERTL